MSLRQTGLTSTHSVLFDVGSGALPSHDLRGLLHLHHLLLGSEDSRLHILLLAWGLLQFLASALAVATVELHHVVRIAWVARAQLVRGFLITNFGQI
jgi:hypothetical protein